MRCPVCQSPMPAMQRRVAGEFCSRRCCGIALNRRSPEASRELDDVVLMRLIDGWPVASTKAERLEASRMLTERGMSVAHIARGMGIKPRSVSRYRAELSQREKTTAS